VCDSEEGVPLLEEGDEGVNPSLVAAYAALLRSIGEDPSREGLSRTPVRAAKAMQFLTSGYASTVDGVTGSALFNVRDSSSSSSSTATVTSAASSSTGMVLVRDIELSSLCEHHLLPFYGRVHIAYLPNERVLGLSKLVRIAEMFARRLQIQERLTQQIADALVAVAKPRGVAVAVECHHMCMAMRGVQRPCSVTSTSAMAGVFETDAALRQEFWAAVSTRRSML